jgi:very-short-patch-repair endonuclease
MNDKSDWWLYFWVMCAPERDLPEAEYKFCASRRFRFDWAHPTAKIAIEIDGGQWAPGGGRHAGDKDREKLNLAASLGWRVFRFSPRQLTSEPDQCVKLVVDLLNSDLLNSELLKSELLKSDL